MLVELDLREDVLDGLRDEVDLAGGTAFFGLSCVLWTFPHKTGIARKVGRITYLNCKLIGMFKPRLSKQGKKRQGYFSGSSGEEKVLFFLFNASNALRINKSSDFG